jgi:hypothetical protein
VFSVLAEHTDAFNKLLRGFEFYCTKFLHKRLSRRLCTFLDHPSVGPTLVSLSTPALDRTLVCALQNVTTSASDEAEQAYTPPRALRPPLTKTNTLVLGAVEPGVDTALSKPSVVENKGATTELPSPLAMLRLYNGNGTIPTVEQGNGCFSWTMLLIYQSA